MNTAAGGLSKTARNRSFYLFLTIVGIHGLGNVIGYTLPIYFKELGFSGFEVGLYFSMSSIAMILMSLPMGVTTDRKSIVTIMMVSFLLLGLSKLGLVVSKSFLVLCAFALIGSFGGRFYSTAMTTLFFKITGPDNQREAGLYQFVNFLTMALGMIFGGYLIAGFSFRDVFLWTFILNWALMALCFLLPRNETVAISAAQYKKAILKPDVLFVTLLFTLSSLHWGAETVAYGRFLKEGLHLSMRATGLYTGLGYVFVGGGALLGAVLLKRRYVRDLKTLWVAGLVLAGAGHILMCVRDPGLSFAFRAFHEVGDGFIFLVFYNGIARMFNMDKIGGCAAFISLCQGCGSFISATVFGVVTDRLGPQWPLIITGAVMLGIPVLMRMRSTILAEPEPTGAMPAVAEAQE